MCRLTLWTIFPDSIAISTIKSKAKGQTYLNLVRKMAAVSTVVTLITLFIFQEWRTLKDHVSVML